MSRPVIGITTSTRFKAAGASIRLPADYARSVLAAGGLPVALPSLEDEGARADYLDLVDGLLFSGGPDVLPRRYGEQPTRRFASWEAARDEFELGLFAAARERGLPVLGICRGEQLVNVAMGGSLYQDLYDQVPGALGHGPVDARRDEPFHSIEIVPGPSLLRSAFGLEGEAEASEVMVNSFHHQAVKELAPGLRVTARSEDGIVEAFEGEPGSAFLLCVQFHPENMTVRFPRFLGIFRFLAAAAEAHRAP